MRGESTQDYIKETHKMLFEKPKSTSVGGKKKKTTATGTGPDRPMSPVLSDNTDTSIMSEISSCKSHQFNHTNSRTQYVKDLTKRIVNQNLSRIANINLNEEIELNKELDVPIAEKFMNKIYARLPRLLAGEHLGPLVDSELENLEVDEKFEMHRQNIEICSISHGQTQDDDDLSNMEIEDLRSIKSEKCLLKQDSIPVIEKIEVIEEPVLTIKSKKSVTSVKKIIVHTIV